MIFIADFQQEVVWKIEQYQSYVTSLKYYISISILELSIDHPWQLRLGFSDHYAIRQLPLKQKGIYNA